MSVDRLNHYDQTRTGTPGSNGRAQRWPDLITHLALALYRHARELRRDSVPVPPEIEDLAASLMQFVGSPQETTSVADYLRRFHHASVTGRLLVTKAEAAERLSVSVRTVERLVTSGQLRLVHVEGAARLRISDLEGYVQSLAEGGQTRFSSRHTQ
jgi:excisionase family DNA binding protein